MQPFQHLLHAFARSISQGHNAEELPVSLDQHDSFAFGLNTLYLLFNRVGDGVTIKQPGVTDGNFLTFEFGAHSFSGHGFGLPCFTPG